MDLEKSKYQVGFSVLDDPWIPVKTKSGQVTEVGIRTLFRSAHEIDEIAPDQPMAKVAIMRFLAAFFSDAYSLKTEQDRKVLFKKGRFDESVLNDYAGICERKYGTSFDLFDEKAPFMTQAYDPKIDGVPGKDSCTLKPANAISILTPDGNNPVFMESPLDFNGYTPAEALRQVLIRYAFPKAGAGGKMCGKKFYFKSGINGYVSGLIPLYFVPKTGSAFVDIVQCMATQTTNQSMKLNDVPAAWNDRTVINGTLFKGKDDANYKGHPIAEVSYVSGLTFQPVRIVLVPDNDGIVRTCYISVGKFLETRNVWVDPMLSYRMPSDEDVKKAASKGKALAPRTPVLTDFAKATWKNADLVAVQKSGSRVIRPHSIVPVCKTGKVFQEIIIFGGTTMTQDTGINGIYYDTLKIPEAFLADEDKAARMLEDFSVIKEIENIDIAGIASHRLKKAEKYGYDKKMREHPRVLKIERDVKQTYDTRIKKVIWDKYLVALAESDPDTKEWDTQMREKFHDAMDGVIKDSIIAIYKTPLGTREINLYQVRNQYAKSAYSKLKNYTGGKNDGSKDSNSGIRSEQPGTA